MQDLGGDTVRILVVEDERDLNQLIQKVLKKSGYSVDGCYDGEEAMHYLTGTQYDIALLDVMLPKRDGYEIVQEMRSRGMDTPVLFLTARDSIADRVKGLDLGADDYLVKPFAFDELLARIRALSRKRVGHRSNRFTVADLTLDVERRQAFRGEREIHLLPKEFSILECLMRSKGNVLSRRQIEDSIWNYDDSPSSNNVDVYISKLRKKIDGDEPVKLLHTIRGVGWSLREPTGADTAETEKEV
jgi:two-component system copper resistance phosphate regulon response regulator CusR